MKNILILITVLIIIAGGLYWAREPKINNGLQTNQAMLQEDSDANISTSTDVAYFEGAKGYLARPAAEGIYPGIVMIHENRGLRPEIKATADDLAKRGYIVLAVDLLGPPVETQEQARTLTANFDQTKALENMKTAAVYLKAQGATKIASLGWCFGGGQSLRLSLSGEPLDATVIYYGQLATTTVALAALKSPVLGIFGETDQVISTTSVRQFEAALEELDIENEIYIYPRVGHAFANPSGMNYAPEETKDAWAKTVAFLERHLE